MKGMPSLLLENQGNARFVDAAEKGGPFFKRQMNLRGCGAFDMDNDGRMDVLLTSMGGPVVLLHNRGASQNHWLTLKLVGTHCNRDGFGAQVKVQAGTRVFQAQAQCPRATCSNGTRGSISGWARNRRWTASRFGAQTKRPDAGPNQYRS